MGDINTRDAIRRSVTAKELVAILQRADEDGVECELVGPEETIPNWKYLAQLVDKEIVDEVLVDVEWVEYSEDHKNIKLKLRVHNLTNQAQHMQVQAVVSGETQEGEYRAGDFYEAELDPEQNCVLEYQLPIPVMRGHELTVNVMTETDVYLSYLRVPVLDFINARAEPQ